MKKNNVFKDIIKLLRTSNDTEFAISLGISGKHIWDINKLSNGKTILHKLIKKNMIESMKILLKIDGINIRTLDKQGKPAHEYIAENQKEILEVINDFRNRAEKYLKRINKRYLNYNDNFKDGLNNYYSITDEYTLNRYHLLELVDARGSLGSDDDKQIIVDLINEPDIIIFHEDYHHDDLFDKVLQQYPTLILAKVCTFSNEKRNRFLKRYPNLLFYNLHNVDYSINTDTLNLYNDNNLLDISTGYDAMNIYHYAIDSLPFLQLLDKEYLFGSKINSRNTFGETPLHIAINNNNLQIIEYLLSVDDINLNIKNFNRFTPLALAVKNNLVQVVDMIERHVNMKAERFMIVYSKLQEDLTKFKRLNPVSVVPNDIHYKMNKLI